jgi:hypothetical protein
MARTQHQTGRMDSQMENFFMKYSFILILLAGSMGQSCKPTAVSYQYSAPSRVEIPEDDKPKILFMTFFIQQKDNKTEIELTDSNVKYGTLKSENQDSKAQYRIYVAQLDKNMAEIAGFYIEHPLRKNVEYTNEENELVSKSIELAEAEFFIRTKLNEQSKHVQLNEIYEDQVLNSFVFNIR